MKALRIFSFLAATTALAACETTASGPGAFEQRGQVIAGSLASSVQLHTKREGGTRRSGSGVVIGYHDDGAALILTTAHLLKPLVTQSIDAIDPSAGGTLAAQILAVNETADLALLKADGLEAMPARLQPDGRLGDSVWVVSFPWGRRGTVVNGVVSQISSYDGGPAIPFEGPVSLIDASVSYGTSGGGIFDDRTGRLVGIVRGYRTAKLTVPGAKKQTLEFPIAGETTVIPTGRVLCLLRDADYESLIPVDLQTQENASVPCIEGTTAMADAPS